MRTLLPPPIAVDEHTVQKGQTPLHAARAELRRQIARLEYRLAGQSVQKGQTPLHVPAAAAEPRLLGLAELEAERDRLVDRLASARERERQAARGHAAARARVEAMLTDPAAHRFEIVTRADLGEPGCGAWHVRPRLGLIGMMLGWWRVTLSSGCP